MNKVLAIIALLTPVVIVVRLVHDNWKHTVEAIGVLILGFAFLIFWGSIVYWLWNL